MNTPRFLNPILCLSALLMVACEPSRIERMSDYELGERYSNCLDNKPTAPGVATACENLRRECERRKQELGSFVCRSR
ncbi:lipoprotein [Simiduia agarivorans SA1 = DSM 21679]|uniref:Lipoprotein n=1 Tax=Simiduia agarivorans (strain DSM 21679 / JCM 13881 / BCRC 17597 / SA1) TaxID=1117647 RepID=K4KL05_SIMAS|nr:lipoprotein [Simiduia agarivorans SA1 = DSM 21679]